MKVLEKKDIERGNHDINIKEFEFLNEIRRNMNSKLVFDFDNKKILFFNYYSIIFS